MTVAIKHDFVSLKGDGSDLTQVQPSNWNANHVLTQASGKVLGRVTAGVGVTEEIDWSAFGRSWLNAASANAALGLLGPISNLANQSVTYRKLQLASAAARIIASNIVPAKTITGASNNGSGLIRLTMTDTSNFTTGERKVVAGVVGTSEANDEWTITVVDSTHIDLQGSVFANNYVSGGTIGGGYEEHTISDLLDFLGSVARGDVLARGASGWVRVPKGTAGQVIRSDGTDTGFGSIPLMHLREEQSSGTDSAFLPVINSWTTSVINTAKVNDISGASLASNLITLPIGTYEIEAFMQGLVQASAGANNACCRITNVTDGVVAIQGMPNSIAASGGGVVANRYSFGVRGRITIAAPKQFALQFFTNNSPTRCTSISQGTEVYSDIWIKKVG